jgi:hypothetical protein
MDKRFALLFISLILIATMVFAVTPALTSNVPINGETLIGTHTYSLDFNILDGNANNTSRNPQIVRIYWSTTSGGRENLIVADTNVQDQSRVLCADYNFIITKDCNYSWTVPDQSTMPNGRYYIDYNFGDFNGTLNAYQYYTSSSGQFTVTQPMATNACSILNILPLILAAVLVIVILGAITVMRNGIDANTLVSLAGLAIATVIGIVILSSVLFGVCI